MVLSEETTAIPAAALIQMTQGATVGAAGEALFGVAGVAVDVANAVNTGVSSWQIELVDVPPGSALTTGIKASSDNSSVPAYSFTPDVAGGYRIVLKVWGSPNRVGTATDTDIRNFGVKGVGGLYLPTQQIWPRPLPPVASGETGAKPDENNFGGQTRGWAGNGSDGLLREMIARVDNPLITSFVVDGVTVGRIFPFISPVINAFAAPGTLTTLVPALGAGLRVVPVSFQVLYVTRSGTITGTPTGKVGTNGAHDNLTPAMTFASAAQLNLSNAGDRAAAIAAALTGTTNVNGAPELSSALSFELVTAATGAGAALTFRLGVTAYVAAFP